MCLDLIHPNLTNVVSQRQQSQRLANDNSQPLWEFNVGDKVLVRYYRTYQSKWSEGIITQVLGPLTYEVSVPDIQITWKRHIDQLVHCLDLIRSLPKPSVIPMAAALGNGSSADISVPSTELENK